MKWPEASVHIAGWISVAIMVFAIAQCTATVKGV